MSDALSTGTPILHPNPHVEALVRDLLGKLGISLTGIEYIPHAAHPIYALSVEESGRLIGRGGETLQALNYLARKIMEQRFGAEESEKFILDINGYHQKHIEELRQKAVMLAERARLFKHDVEMAPMSAYERMIVHATFAESQDIATLSEGKGKFRRVVIKYKGDSPIAPPGKDA